MLCSRHNRYSECRAHLFPLHLELLHSKKTDATTVFRCSIRQLERITNYWTKYSINSALLSSLCVMIFSLPDCSPVQQRRPYTAKTTACILNHTPIHEITYTTQKFILLKLEKFTEIGTMWDARTKPQIYTTLMVFMSLRYEFLGKTNNRHIYIILCSHLLYC